MKLGALLLTLAAAAATAIGADSPGDPPAAPGAFAPSVARTGTGAVASWLEPIEGRVPTAHRLRVARFEGDVWTAAVTVLESDALFANWADTPGVVVAGDGSILAWWLEKLGTGTYAYGIRVARSRDGGATWTPLGWLQDDTSESEHGFVSAVAEGDGARAFWLDGRATPGGGAMTLRTARVGERVEASGLVDAAVCDCCATGAATLEGRSVVAYRDRTGEEIRDIRLARVDSSGGATEAPVAADGWRISGCPVNGPSAAAAAGRLAVAWFTAPDDRPRVTAAWSGDSGATFGAPIVIDSAAPLGRVGLAPLPDGDVALSWLARAGEAAEVRLVRVTADGRAGQPFVVGATAAGRQSGVPRTIELGAGRLLVLWTEAAGGPTRLRATVVAAAALTQP